MAGDTYLRFTVPRGGSVMHLDHPWSACVKDGAPIRLYLRTRWGFVQIGEKSQVYDRKTKRYTDLYAFVTVRPR